MAKGPNQKLKLMYLMQILMENTDENHSLTMPEILSSLDACGVSAERKSIYSDMEYLRTFGIDVVGEQRDKAFHYYIASRDFELPELKLLVDSVQSAKFITEKKSNELIKKLENLCSRHEATQLQRQVYVGERVKTMNENIYYNVDTIHTAIGSNSKITFQYYQWDVNKKMVLKKDGARYEVSPWALSWDDSNYYLIAFDSAEDKIKHFRVDKMLHIDVSDEKREGKAHFKQFDMASYTKKMFGMFSGEEEMVKLRCDNAFAGVMIDRFGKNAMIVKEDDSHFLISVKVAVSRQFLAWVIALGDGVKIVGPDSVVTKINEEIDRLVCQYRKE